jgi:hypothetical protein
MFGVDGTISSFSKKMAMAYALGIIDKDYRRLIDIVREIRNACAHSRKPISLVVPVVSEACKVVISDMLPDLKDQKPETIRIAFVSKCAFISHYIGTGEKVEGSVAQLKYVAKLRQAKGVQVKRSP